jgi:hypothetical protein
LGGGCRKTDAFTSAGLRPKLGANLVVCSVQPLGQEIHLATKTIKKSEGHNLTTATVQQTANSSDSVGQKKADLILSRGRVLSGR